MAVSKNTYKPKSKKIIEELQDTITTLKTTNKVIEFELNYYKHIPYWKLDSDKREIVDNLIFELLTKQV